MRQLKTSYLSEVGLWVFLLVSLYCYEQLCSSKNSIVLIPVGFKVGFEVGPVDGAFVAVGVAERQNQNSHVLSTVYD